MSYISVGSILNDRNIDMTTASEAELRDALYAAFEKDLSLGLQCLIEDINAFKQSGETYMATRDPNSPEGKQIIRLVGADIPRSIIEEKHEVTLGLYNCCKTVVGKPGHKLAMTALDQIRFQDPALANC